MTISQNFSLQPFNSFGIATTARYFASFETLPQMEEGIAFYKKQQCNLMLLGGGSNVLFTRPFDGLVLKNELKGITLVQQNDDYVFLKAGAGEGWHAFVQYCIQKNLAGVENLSLIPGSVGASPMQNIGAYGVEIKDVFHSLEAYDLTEQKMVNFSLNDCEFGYRESVFKNKFRNRFIITSVTYRLNKKPVFQISYGAIAQELETMGVNDLSIAAISAAVIRIRQAKLPNPADIGNAGSFFKNPTVKNTLFTELKKQYPSMVGFPVTADSTKLAAGWLIEQCGWKGYRTGDAGCHAKQALVLVNYGNATGNQLFHLSEAIIQSVYQKFGVTLTREVNIY